jgi:uncharacterized protein YndB with AHSA1/START domain
MTTPDVPHRFELTLEVPGTEAQVWAAIASAEGISAWMMPTELDAREGGDLVFHMGPDAESRGRVTAFEPSRRVEYEEHWDELVGRPGADVTPLVTEFVVEARSGGTCVVRVVTSAFGTGADWEHEFFEEMSRGWAPMLDNLRLYLTHFPGQHVTTMWATAATAASPEAVIAAARAALGADAVGAAVTRRGISGRVERAVDRHFLVHVDEPVSGFLAFYAFGDDDGGGVHLQGYLFSDAAPSYVADEQAAWQAWLDGVAADAAAGAPAGSATTEARA